MEKRVNTAVGFTKLGWLEVSPLYFLHRLEKEEKQSYFDFGTAVHLKVLQPEKFDKEVIVTEFEIPEGKNADFVKHLFITKEMVENNAISKQQWYDNAFKFAGLKTKIATTIAKFEEAGSDLSEYYNFLVTSKDKIILGPKDMKSVQACYDNISKHKLACGLIYDNLFTDILSMNEKLITWTHPKYPEIVLESTLDRFDIYPEFKKIVIWDLKTTSSNVNNFQYSYRQYKYYRQAAIYIEALKYFMKTDLEMNPELFTFEYRIVAVQSSGLNECAVYRVPKQDLEVGRCEFEVLLERFQWHSENDKWDYPVEYYQTEGITELSLTDDIVPTENINTCSQ